MTISYAIYPEYGLLLTRYIGIITDRELIDTYAKAYNDLQFSNSFKELSDLREVENSTVSAEGMRQLAKMIDAMNKGREEPAHSAQIVKTKFHIGLCRMYGAYSDLHSDEKHKYFYTISEALDWLGISSEPLLKLLADKYSE